MKLRESSSSSLNCVQIARCRRLGEGDWRLTTNHDCPIFREAFTSTFTTSIAVA